MPRTSAIALSKQTTNNNRPAADNNNIDAEAAEAGGVGAHGMVERAGPGPRCGDEGQEAER